VSPALHRLLTALLLFLPLAAPGLSAQERATARNEFTFDVTPIRGTMGYARALSPTRLAGLEVGFGAPQVDRTLHPPDGPDPETTTDDPDFEEFLHLGAFLRVRPRSAFEVDTGLRVGVADLWECTASDCWPSLFAGAYLQPMLGGQRWKVGARLVAGWIGESREGGQDSSTFTVALSPLVLRVTFPR
jgi:hypothetical protein